MREHDVSRIIQGGLFDRRTFGGCSLRVRAGR